MEEPRRNDSELDYGNEMAVDCLKESWKARGCWEGGEKECYFNYL